MAYSRFHAEIIVRVLALGLTIALCAWMVVHTSWYVNIGLFAAAALGQAALLVRFASRPGREVARFLDSIAFDDTSAGFSALREDAAFAELGAAMSRVLDALRIGRNAREEQAQYLQSLVSNIPVALISVDQGDRVHLLNMAARRLFGAACTTTAQFRRYGESFATGLESLKPGDGVILRMERAGEAPHLKAAATDLTLGGVRRRLISLQNIESELSANELAAWQAVIRVMAHEVMNSLTPVSSLASTAQQLVSDVLKDLPGDDANRAALGDAVEALETVARRSQGLLHFVQNHRRLTKRMVANIEIVPVRRVFARLQRLLAGELTARDIALTLSIVPETLELSVDGELLDQALINLVRNAMEALRDKPSGQIALAAFQDASGRAVIAVADNGPGIAPDQREKVFVPFFTTKRQGSGVGLTLVRQIVTLHGANVRICETAGGGATVSMEF
jgi:two-component system nitrogen regulation sensor histidine kinase NtrY